MEAARADDDVPAGAGGKKLFTWNRGLWDNALWHVESCGGLEGLGLKSV